MNWQKFYGPVTLGSVDAEYACVEFEPTPFHPDDIVIDELVPPGTIFVIHLGDADETY